MKTIQCWSDLRPFGLDCLTGEACGLMYRILFDLTAQGKTIVEKCLDVKIASEPWNCGSPDDPHKASIMLSPEMMVPIGIFALLESGCTEVWMLDGALFGIEASDTEMEIDIWRTFHEKNIRRMFSYRGTAGSRNLHVFSGRVT